MINCFLKSKKGRKITVEVDNIKQFKQLFHVIKCYMRNDAFAAARYAIGILYGEQLT